MGEIPLTPGYANNDFDGGAGQPRRLIAQKGFQNSWFFKFNQDICKDFADAPTQGDETPVVLASISGAIDQGRIANRRTFGQQNLSHSQLIAQQDPR